jgi:hypothetical protein
MHQANEAALSIKRRAYSSPEAVDKVALLLKWNSVIAFRETSLRSFSRMVLAGIQIVTLTHCFY